MSVGVYTSHGDVSFTTAVNNALCQTHKHLFARGNSVSVENSIHPYRLTHKHTANVHENTQGTKSHCKVKEKRELCNCNLYFFVTSKETHIIGCYLETKRLVK